MDPSPPVLFPKTSLFLISELWVGEDLPPAPFLSLPTQLCPEFQRRQVQETGNGGFPEGYKMSTT